MERELSERLNNLTKQNGVLSDARAAYLLKEAERKHFEATLIKSSPGKSQIEKTMYAQSSPDWLRFHKDLAELEAQFEYQKLKYEILDKAFLATHLSLKLDADTLKR